MKLFYPKFAWDAIRKNRRSYIPYMLTTLFVVAVFHILRNITWMPYLIHQRGASEITMTASLGSFVIAIFSAIFLFYTSSFLMKQRKKEFGLYCVLGMERRHIARILFYETLILAVIGIGLGLLFGALLDYLSYLLLMYLIGSPSGTGFSLSINAFTDTLGIFAVIFLAVYLNNLRQVHFSSVISLLKSGSEGEREPKSKWILTVLGVIFLAAGYILAITIKNPIGALMMFFVAVVLVILGTYCLFTSGSIVFLKLLRRNKKYYYKTRHFISVSGMLYRMKQNAVSLGNICILSTMVLVTVSSTMSLYAGSQKIVESRAPHSVNLTFWGHEATNEGILKAEDAALTIAQELNGASVQPETFRYVTYRGILKGNTLTRDNVGEVSPTLDEFTNAASVSWIPLSDYNRLSGANAALNSGEALMYTTETYTHSTMTVGNTPVTIAKSIPAFPLSNQLTTSAYPCYVLVVPDQDFSSLSVDGSSLTITYVGFDLRDSALEETFSHQWSSFIEDQFGKTDTPFAYSIATRSVIEEELLSSYAGLFFLGIFLGILFLMATALIIYYKQISEGYDDHDRFQIMQKVGMSRKEVKKTIHKQILTVFFLPIVVAVIHVGFAFGVICKLLSIFYLTDVGLFLLCTIGVIICDLRYCVRLDGENLLPAGRGKRIEKPGCNGNLWCGRACLFLMKESRCGKE